MANNKQKIGEVIDQKKYKLIILTSGWLSAIVLKTIVILYFQGVRRLIHE